MKKLIILFFGLLLLGSCSVNTSGNVNIDADDIQYVKDDRTGLCFAIVASRKAMSTDATGLGMACVPCDSLKNVKVK